jgi:ATP-binding cassette subfamily B protein
VATEADTQQALDKLLVNKTAIIIAHRLSTIRNVDRIVVAKYGS